MQSRSHRVAESGTVLLRRRALGDVVMLAAVTGQVPKPVTVVTDPNYVSIARRMRGVSTALPFERAGDAKGRVIDLQADWRTRRQFPWAARLRKHSLSRRVRPLLGFGPGRPDVPTLYASAAGVTPMAPPWFDIPDLPRDTLALVPCASTSIKRWSPDRFTQIAAMWNGPVCAFGGPDDADLLRQIVAPIADAEVVSEIGYEKTLLALARCKVVVGNDTGLLHLAAACGVTPVGLFGPTHPNDGFFPWSDGRVVELSLPCRPCTLHRRDFCHTQHHGCMGQDVPTVWQAIEQCASLS